jgi:lysophospholipase L1-like esterase
MIPTRLPLIPALLLALTCAARADFTVVWPQPKPPPGTPPQTFPQPRFDCLPRFLDNLEKLKAGPYDMILDGDSITDLWQGPGAGVWQKHFGAIKTANFAISGDGVQSVLWRLRNGELKGQNPKLIMLMIGTNNINQNPKDVADGIKLLLNEYETQCPDSHILLLGIFPRVGATDWIAKVNPIISTYDDGKRVTYLDIGPKFLQPDGTFSKENMPDTVHPSPKGYEIWAEAIQPVMDKYFPTTTSPAK